MKWIQEAGKHKMVGPYRSSGQYFYGILNSSKSVLCDLGWISCRLSDRKHASCIQTKKVG